MDKAVDFTPEINNVGEAFDHFEVPDARGNKFVKYLSKKIEKKHIPTAGNIGAKQEELVAQLQKLEEKRILAKGVALLEALEEGLEKREDLTFMNEIKSNKNELVGVVESEGFSLIDNPSLITEPLCLIDENTDVLSVKKIDSKTNFEVETLSKEKVVLPTTKEGLSALARFSDNSNVFMIDNLSNLGKVHKVDGRWVPFVSAQNKMFPTMIKFVADYESYKANWLNTGHVANEESIKVAVEQKFKDVEPKYRPTALNAEALVHSLVTMNRLELDKLSREFHAYFEQLLNDPNKATILLLQQSLPLEGSEELRMILDLGGAVNKVAMKELLKGKCKILKELVEFFLKEIPQDKESPSVLALAGTDAKSRHQKLENIAQMKSFELSA